MYKTESGTTNSMAVQANDMTGEQEQLSPSSALLRLPFSLVNKFIDCV